MRTGKPGRRRRQTQMGETPPGAIRAACESFTRSSDANSRLVRLRVHSVVRAVFCIPDFHARFEEIIHWVWSNAASAHKSAPAALRGSLPD
jgi:hypothetical protein